MNQQHRIMIFIYRQLDLDARWKAIYTYCYHMNCLGMNQELIEKFLLKKDNIFFDENGRIILHSTD